MSQWLCWYMFNWPSSKEKPICTTTYFHDVNTPTMTKSSFQCFTTKCGVKKDTGRYELDLAYHWNHFKEQMRYWLHLKYYLSYNSINKWLSSFYDNDSVANEDMIWKVMITVVIDGDKVMWNSLTSGENKKNFKNYKKFHLHTQNNLQIKLS